MTSLEVRGIGIDALYGTNLRILKGKISDKIILNS